MSSRSLNSFPSPSLPQNLILDLNLFVFVIFYLFFNVFNDEIDEMGYRYLTEGTSGGLSDTF